MNLVSILLSTLLYIAPAQETYLIQEVGPFRLITRDESQAEEAGFIANILLEALPRMESTTGYRLNREILIFVTRDQADFNLYAGSVVPEWGEAFAIPHEGAIVLKSPSFASKKLSYRNVVIHELAHVMLHLAVDGNDVPVWFNEGFAMFTATEDREFSDLATALFTDSQIPLHQIDDILRFNRNRAGLAYEQSHSAVLFLTESFGDSAVAIMIDGFRQSLEQDSVLLRATGLNLDQFQSEWIEYARSENRWAVLLQTETILWVFVMPLLFLIAVLAVRLRSRRIKKRWEEEGE